MGDRTTCYLRIGGKITKAAARALTNAIAEFNNCEPDEDLPEGGAEWMEEFEEVNYGSMSGKLRDALIASGATFVWRWCTGDGYGDGCVFGGPGIGRGPDGELLSADLDFEGETYARVDYLRERAAAGDTIEQALARLNIPPVVPPVEYVEEPVAA